MFVKHKCVHNYLLAGGDMSVKSLMNYVMVRKNKKKYACMSEWCKRDERAE